MKRNDLKNGMVVENREGTKYLVADDKLLRFKGFCLLENFDEDLICYSSYFTIDKVYTVNNESIRGLEDIFDQSNLTEIWRRAPKKMTIEEIEDLLGFEVEIIE